MDKPDYKEIANKIIAELFSVQVYSNGEKTDRFRVVSKKDFEKRKDELFSTINKDTTEIEFVAIMRKVFALLKNAHTTFNGKLTNSNNILNVSFKIFNANFKILNEKVYVFNSDKEYLQVLTINGIDIEQIKNDFAELIPYEIDAWKNVQMEKMFGFGQSYEMIKADKNGTVLEIEGIDKHGEKQNIKLAGQETIKNDNQQKTKTKNGRKSPFYDFKLLNNGKLYIDYSKCLFDEHYPMETFISDMKTAIGDKKITGVVFDLRQNTGGNSELIKPLIDFFKKYKIGNNVAVLGGANTFSSGIWAVQSIRESFNAKLIGETLGQPARRYGQGIHKKVDGFSFSVSEKFFDMSKTLGTNGEIKPDIKVKQTLEDYISGNDRQFKTALEYISSISRDIREM